MFELYISGFSGALLKIIFIPLGVMLLFSLLRLNSTKKQLLNSSYWRFFLVLFIVVFLGRFIYCLRFSSGSQRYESPLLVFIIILAIPGFFYIVKYLRCFFEKKHRISWSKFCHIGLLLCIFFSSTAKALHPSRYKAYLHKWGNIIQEECDKNHSSKPLLFDLIGDTRKLEYYYNMRNKVVSINGNLGKSRYSDDFLHEFDNKIKDARLDHDQIFILVNNHHKNNILSKLKNNFPIFPYRQLAKYSGKKNDIYLYSYDYKLTASLFPDILQPTPQLKNRVKLIMPPEIYVCAGKKINVYFDNLIIVPNIRNYNIVVKCKFGIQYNDRWSYKPNKESKEKSFTLEVEIRDAANWPVAKGKSIIKVVHNSALLSNSGSILQASLFNHYNFFPDYLLSSLKVDSKKRNIILRDKKSKFLLQNIYDAKQPVRVIYFLLSLNGITNLHKAHSFEYITNLVIKKIDYLQKKYKDVAIGICIPPVPAGSQDDYAGFKITRWQLKMNQHRIVKFLINHYGDRRQQNLYLIPLNVVVNSNKDYIGSKNILLLGPSGYMGTANEIAAWIQYVLDKKNIENKILK